MDDIFYLLLLDIYIFVPFSNKKRSLESGCATPLFYEKGGR